MTPVRAGGGWRHGVLVLTAVLVAACGGAPDDQDGEVRDGTTDRVSESPVLDCTRLGYPCTEAEVPAEVRRETVRLARAAQLRLFDEPGLAALDWIRRQPNVAHAAGDAHVIRFRLDGGRPFWVLGEHRLEPDASAVTRLEFTAPDGHREAPAARRPGLPWLPSLPLVATLQAEPVGEDRDQDGHVTDRDFRRALILDPFRWEWTRRGADTRYREGMALAGMLEAAPGFTDDGVVTYLADTEVTEPQFGGWDGYDLVHYSGHAETVCEEDDGPCRSVILTGETRPLDEISDPSDSARELALAGYTDPATGALVQQKHVALSADWFRMTYAGGQALDRTIVFVNACRSINPADHGFVPDYLAAIAGSGDGTTVLGWDDYVPSLAAQTAALDFYEALIRDGARAGDVVDRLPADETAVQNSRERTARLGAGSGGGRSQARAEGRIREVVALHEPGGARLTDGPQPRTVLEGTAGDGRDERLNVDLVVDGVEDDEVSRWSVDVLLDDRPIRRGVRLSEGQSIGDRRYRIPLPGLSLDRDLRPDEPATLEAVATLPEGGESRSKISITLPESWYRLTAGGDATGNQQGWIWARRLVANPGLDPASDICHVEIRFEPEGEGLSRLTALPTFGLSIGARGGLRAQTYQVGRTGMGLNVVQLRQDNPDIFFAAMGAHQANPPAGLPAAYGNLTFFSSGGTVTISAVDRNRIEGSFQVRLWGVGYGARTEDALIEATADGQFAGAFTPNMGRRVSFEPPWGPYTCEP